MEFGKIIPGNQVDYTLPSDHPETISVLKSVNPVTYLQPQFYVGTVQWTNKDWRGIYYPAGLPDKDALLWYGRNFNTIELNTTHYQIPDAKIINKWREAVKPDFKFCPKIPQTISHGLALPQAAGQTKAFCTSIIGLKENLGTCFLQLPPTFGISECNLLIKYLEGFPDSIPLAVELRSKDWFTQQKSADTLFRVMQELNIIPVLTDVAMRRDVLHMRLTTGTVFIRFNAYGAQTIDYARLDEWVNRLKVWLDWGLQRVYFMMHEERSLSVPLLTNYLIDKLNKVCGIKLDKCLPIGPVQGSLF